MTFEKFEFRGLGRQRFAEGTVLEGLEDRGGAALGAREGGLLIVVVVVSILGHHGAIEGRGLAGASSGKPAGADPVAEEEQTEAAETDDETPANRRAAISKHLGFLPPQIVNQGVHIQRSKQPSMARQRRPRRHRL
jgi:hypothetical protein